MALKEGILALDLVYTDYLAATEPIPKNYLALAISPLGLASAFRYSILAPLSDAGIAAALDFFFIIFMPPYETVDLNLSIESIY